MATKPSIDSVAIGRFLTIELARATELAAVAAARFRGRGDEMAAGEAALLAMRTRRTGSLPRSASGESARSWMEALPVVAGLTGSGTTSMPLGHS